MQTITVYNHYTGEKLMKQFPCGRQVQHNAVATAASYDTS